MSFKNLTLSTVLFGVATSAAADGYVISFEAAMKNNFRDETSTILNLQTDTYKECYDAGKPLKMKGKLYINLDKAPSLVEYRGYQGKYEDFDDQWFQYELTIPNHNILSHNPNNPDYCIDNNLHPRSQLFIGSTDILNAETGVRREQGRILLTDDYQRYSSSDAKDMAWIRAQRDTYINESDTAYRHYVTVLLSLEKYGFGATSDLISSYYDLGTAFIELANTDLSELSSHVRDRHELKFDYKRYIEGDTIRTTFNAEILDITSVEYTPSLDYSHIECLPNLENVYLNPDKYYCF